MPGWNLSSGSLQSFRTSEDEYWAIFNHVFSESSKKRNTYKFGFLKAILDNLFNGDVEKDMYYISYESLFEKFTANYWNLVVKYELKQMRKDGRSDTSKIEQILKSEVVANPVLSTLEFYSIDTKTRSGIVKKVSLECRKNVVGALYNDTNGLVYAFDLKSNGIAIGMNAYEFLLKFKVELEKLNYYAWAKFLEKINDDNALIRVLDKLELATPKRNDLSIFRKILCEEFEQHTCFYCGKKLKSATHVDHFIPWSYIKSDNLWNFVLSCHSCNEKKNNKIPDINYLNLLRQRNQKAISIQNDFVKVEFQNYSDGDIERLWKYAHLTGLKEFTS